MLNFLPTSQLVAQFLNYLLYQIGWFACVIGAATANHNVGVAIAATLAVIHLIATTDRSRQVRIALAGVGIGLLVDTGLLQAGIYSFPNGQLVNGLPPLWMTLLWIQFAMTTQYCMRWMSGRYVIAALFGLFGAPLAFIAGESLGAITFLEPRILHVTILGIVWSAAVPALIFVSDRLYRGSSSVPTYALPGGLWLGLNSMGNETRPDLSVCVDHHEVQ